MYIYTYRGSGIRQRNNPNYNWIRKMLKLLNFESRKFYAYLFISYEIIPSSNTLRNNTRILPQRIPKRKHEYNYIQYILNFAKNNHGTRVSSPLPSSSSPFTPTILPTPTLSHPRDPIPLLGGGWNVPSPFKTELRRLPFFFFFFKTNKRTPTRLK